MLAGVTNLGTIRMTCQQQADMVASNFVTTPEWNSYINASYQALYNLLIQNYGDNYFATVNYQFTTDGTNEYFTLPDGSGAYAAFFKLLGVDLWISSAQTQPNQWLTLKRFNFGERNKWSYPNSIAPYGYIALKYRLDGNRLWLRPLPQAGQLIQVRYAPRLTLLANDTDTADLVSGWEEWIVCDVVLKAKQKEESDASIVMARKEELRRDIEAASANRDVGEPETVTDVSGSLWVPW